MKYKALFLDVDGTIVPYHKNYPALIPTDRVTKSIQQAAKRVTVCFTTGRPYSMMIKILNRIDMKRGYAIINDGAQVIDLATGDILYERMMNHAAIHAICALLKDLHIEFFINDNEEETRYTTSYHPSRPLNVLVRFLYTEKEIDAAITELSRIPSIKVNKTYGGTEGTYGLLISHAEATKLHGIIEVSKRLKVKREETIGVGDSGNDFPLLMASGFKVAMGNAIADLKDVADYIAPSVDDDGIVDVINRFILSKK